MNQNQHDYDLGEMSYTMTEVPCQHATAKNFNLSRDNDRAIRNKGCDSDKVIIKKELEYGSPANRGTLVKVKMEYKSDSETGSTREVKSIEYRNPEPVTTTGKHNIPIRTVGETKEQWQQRMGVGQRSNVAYIMQGKTRG